MKLQQGLVTPLVLQVSKGALLWATDTTTENRANRVAPRALAWLRSCNLRKPRAVP